jgi:hypothetical protein
MIDVQILSILSRLQTVSSWLGLPALVSAIFVTWYTAYLKRKADCKIANLRNEHERVLAELNSQLHRVEDAAKVRFSWLHEHRSEAIVELFAAIADLGAPLDFKLSVAPTPEELNNMGEILKEFQERNIRALNKYRALSPRVFIFFPEAMEAKLVKIAKLYCDRVAIFGECLPALIGDAELRPDFATKMKAWDENLCAISELLQKLKHELRELLAVHERQ